MEVAIGAAFNVAAEFHSEVLAGQRQEKQAGDSTPVPSPLSLAAQATVEAKLASCKAEALLAVAAARAVIARGAYDSILVPQNPALRSNCRL
jgi:hypothetical protein